VRDADATLIVRRDGTAGAGTDWTHRCASALGKPLLVVDPTHLGAAQHITDWLASVPIETLNVAGPSESASPGIGSETYALFLRAFRGPK
jgi:hypothetical protein